MLVLYYISGLLGVTNMVIWGVYGDLLLEEFSYKKVIRSLAIGFFVSTYLYWVDSNLPFFIVALIVIAFERGVTEIYKALIRDERQVKYLIPSDLNIDFPRSIEKAAGVLIIIGSAVLFKQAEVNLHPLAIFLIAAFLPALGGMMKDAPYEGFFPLKFFRSPLVVVAVGTFLLWVFPTLQDKYFLLAIWGGERIISECYKKIIKGVPPGKFKRDTHHHMKHSWKVKRRFLLVPYILSVILILSLLVFS